MNITTALLIYYTKGKKNITPALLVYYPKDCHQYYICLIDWLL